MRKPSTFFESSFSFSFLRTMPARKPRTECCCQPVAFIIAAIVAPSGDRSIVITRACFEPGPAFLLDGLPAVADEGFPGGISAAGAVDGFFERFDMEILRSVHVAFWPHHRRPTSAKRPAGQDLWGALGAPTIRASTAPFSPESQSFLDNDIAQFADVG